MSAYKAWAARQRGNPIFLMLGIMGITGTLYLGYTKLWSPFTKRRRLARAEAFANYLYEQENKHGKQ